MSKNCMWCVYAKKVSEKLLKLNTLYFCILVNLHKTSKMAKIISPSKKITPPLYLIWNPEMKWNEMTKSMSLLSVFWFLTIVYSIHLFLRKFGASRITSTGSFGIWDFRGLPPRSRGKDTSIYKCDIHVTLKWNLYTMHCHNPLGKKISKENLWGFY